MVAARRLERGAEVAVDGSVAVGCPAAAGFQLEVTFDGGARAVHGRRVVGAGAVLGRRGPCSGEPVRWAEAVMALPGVGCSRAAEARSCRLAPDLLLACRATCRQARVSGDGL